MKGDFPYHIFEVRLLVICTSDVTKTEHPRSHFNDCSAWINAFHVNAFAVTTLENVELNGRSMRDSTFEKMS